MSACTQVPKSLTMSEVLLQKYQVHNGEGEEEGLLTFLDVLVLNNYWILGLSFQKTDTRSLVIIQDKNGWSMKTG